MSTIAPTQIFEGFSVSHAAILDGATSAENITLGTGVQMYGVRNGNIAPNVGQFDNTGDDAVLSSWYWIDFAAVDITSGYISLPVLSSLTGKAISSSGSGASQLWEFDLWHEDMMNIPPRPLWLRVPSRDSDGAVRRLDFVLYRVQFGPFSMTGPAYKTGLEATYTGRAVYSLKDETSTPFPDNKKRVGRMISGPVI